MREIEFSYEYPIKARRFNDFDVDVRLMRKDEMPDDGKTYYCDVDGTIYMQGEPDFELIKS